MYWYLQQNYLVTEFCIPFHPGLCRGSFFRLVESENQLGSMKFTHSLRKAVIKRGT